MMHGHLNIKFSHHLKNTYTTLHTHTHTHTHIHTPTHMTFQQLLLSSSGDSSGEINIVYYHCNESTE